MIDLTPAWDHAENYLAELDAAERIDLIAEIERLDPYTGRLDNIDTDELKRILEAVKDKLAIKE